MVLAGKQYQLSIDYSILSENPNASQRAGDYLYAPDAPAAVWGQNWSKAPAVSVLDQPSRVAHSQRDDRFHRVDAGGAGEQAGVGHE